MKMSDVAWVRNLVLKEHMLSNNLPLGEPKPAEIKLKAAKNAQLKSLRSDRDRLWSSRAEMLMVPKGHSKVGAGRMDRVCWTLELRGKCTSLKLI